MPPGVGKPEIPDRLRRPRASSGREVGGDDTKLLLSGEYFLAQLVPALVKLTPGLRRFGPRFLEGSLRCLRTGSACPYSCKGRSFCPSCGGWCMPDAAAHLVDRVIPEVPVRQWSSPRRADENTCCHRFPGCDPQGFNPHEGPAHHPCGVGPRHGECLVAERPIRSAIRCDCAQRTRRGRLIVRPAIRDRCAKDQIRNHSLAIKLLFGRGRCPKVT
jgi:hypothetical protein